MNETKRLTERQRRLAEEQHNILLDFLKSRHLAMDEYYDIAVFPFLEAVCEYDERKDEIDSFELFAIQAMSTAIGQHFKDQRNERGNVVVLSLDYQMSYPEKIIFGDTIADGRNAPDVCVKRKHSRPNGGYRLLHRYSCGNALRQSAFRRCVEA
ncbi:MAG: hypothetical protein KIG65_00975 [Eubacteriales bacterium]|nr:hypothetical protein [Eubacteriales bacterium]